MAKKKNPVEKKKKVVVGAQVGTAEDFDCGCAGRDVLVMGVGTIGEPLTRLLLEHRDDLGIGNVYFAKFNPTDLGTVKLLQEAGGKFVIWKDTEAHFEHVFAHHGLKIDGTVEDSFKKACVIADCTNRGNALKEDYYSRLRYPIGFLAQGSEEGFGHPFAYGINDETLVPGEHKYLQIVSCNTHNILSLLRTAEMAGGEILAADFVLMRRMNDISQVGQAIGSPSVEQVKDKYPGYGSHQAFDAARVLRTKGVELHNKIHSTALKLDNQLMHLNRFRVRFKKKITKADFIQAVHDDKFMSMSHLRDMNLVFSKGRDHGFHGRIFNQSVIIHDAIEISPDGREVFGACFTPQDGNSLLSSVAAIAWYFNPNTYKEKMKLFDAYLDRFHIIYA
jgi:glyceraldehyde-3-phosphate dehydrogenase/erythrose-4-phosphate dehydrogenase